MQGSEPLHMLWQIPQYLAVVVGEVMFVVTSMDFFYTQVSKSDHMNLCTFELLSFSNLFSHTNRPQRV